MDSLPDIKTNNVEFSKDVIILDKLLEKILKTASNLRPIIPTNNAEMLNLKLEYLNNLGLPLSTDYSSNPLIKLLRGYMKGIHGEQLLFKELKNNFSNHYYQENITLTNDKDKIELDAIMVIGNNVLTFESKNYSADKIIFSKAGQGIIVKKNKRKVISVIGQLNRHYRILKDILNNENITIYNFFVMTDKKTPLENNMGFQFLKAVYVNGLSYEIRELKLKNNINREKEISEIIKNSHSTPLEFTSKNLKLIEKWLINSYENIDYEKMIHFKDLLNNYDDEKMQLNARNIEHNINIYKEISHMIEDYYKDKIYVNNN